jgi:transcriptional regulator with XRE-family HTH domain
MPISDLLTFDVMSNVKFSADIRKEFGLYMQQEREKCGLTQKYVAKKIGISTTQLSRIETGKSGTERDTVILWAQTIGVDENDALRRVLPASRN